MPRDIAQLKAAIGYPEGASEQPLREALTHRSYAVEHELGFDNQRLEFLGDAVLEIALSEYLFERYPDADEGVLTRMRSALACESAIAELAKKLQLGDYLFTGRGEAGSGGARRESTLADLFEAVVAALYRATGFEQTNRFLRDLFATHFPDPKAMLDEINPKGMLQEWAQARWGEHPVYSVFRISGPEHQPVFEVEVRLHKFTACGQGAGRRAAESAAAAILLRYLKAHYPNKK